MKVTLVLAMTADGKISDVQKSPPTFSSARDRTHLERQIARSDAILVGSGTLADGGEIVLVKEPDLVTARTSDGRSAQPIQIICSRTGRIDRDLPFFSQPISRWLLTTQIGATDWLGLDRFDRVLICETSDGKDLDWQLVAAELVKLNIENICCLGGAELAASLFAVGFIDDVWLTVCPFIYGGSAAPSPVSGCGFTPELAPRLKLLSVDRVEDELFLHYQVQK
jgi:5-amino-6-(5-phosphoribosylamino)uracil reductase